MMMNKVGSYHFSGGKGEMPKPVKALGKILGGGREEDAFYGYVQMQRLANRVMRFLPEHFGGEKVHDARIWMTVSTYWSNSGEDNVLNMLLYIAEKLLHLPVKSEAPKEIGTMGVYHPEYYNATKEFFPDLKHYLKWEKKTGATEAINQKLDCFYHVSMCSQDKVMQVRLSRRSRHKGYACMLVMRWALNCTLLCAHS